MQIAQVIGTVVATQKNRKLEGAKLMLVQPLTLEGEPRGTTLIAIDSVGGERLKHQQLGANQVGVLHRGDDLAQHPRQLHLRKSPP